MISATCGFDVERRMSSIGSGSLFSAVSESRAAVRLLPLTPMSGVWKSSATTSVNRASFDPKYLVIRRGSTSAFAAISRVPVPSNPERLNATRAP